MIKIRFCPGKMGLSMSATAKRDAPNAPSNKKQRCGASQSCWDSVQHWYFMQCREADFHYVLVENPLAFGTVDEGAMIFAKILFRQTLDTLGLELK